MLVPAEVLLRWAVFKSSIKTFEWYLWPSAIWCMATDVPNARAAYILEVLALAVGANVVLYATVGVLTWPLRYLAVRRSRSLKL